MAGYWGCACRSWDVGVLVWDLYSLQHGCGARGGHPSCILLGRRGLFALHGARPLKGVPPPSQPCLVLVAEGAGTLWGRVEVEVSHLSLRASQLFEQSVWLLLHGCDVCAVPWSVHMSRRSCTGFIQADFRLYGGRWVGQCLWGWFFSRGCITLSLEPA